MVNEENASAAVTMTASVWPRLLRAFLALPSQRTQRPLVLRSTLPLGGKRFVALIEVEGERFLIGGGSQSVNLLARLAAVAGPKSSDTRESGNC